MIDDLPNGFTGFSKRKPGFVSAGDAMRKARTAAELGIDDTDYRKSERQAANSGWKLPTYSSPITGHKQKSLWGGGNDFLSADLHRFLKVPDVNKGESAPIFDYETLSEIPEIEKRWSWVEVNLGAIQNNTVAIKQLIPPDTMLMAVVKADAYGHGAVACAKTALNSGAGYLGVATVDEAVELRRANIGAPILVLAEPPAATIPLLLAYQIMPTIYTPEFAVQYGEAADSVGMKAPYHLKVNTGMNRIGVRFDDVIEFMRRVSFHRALDLVGTFTHFATADMPDSMEFRIQVAHFVETLDEMRSFGIDPGIVHAANSAAIIRYPEVHFDMVRLGISLYGFYPCPEAYGKIDLTPAMSVHARITQVKSVPVGEGVSYGLLHRSTGYAKVCTLPIGYADGFRRELSDRTDVIMNGQLYPQVGTICMDQSMFEVEMRSHGSGVGPDPQIGDEVLIAGMQGDAVVTIDAMAEMLGTVPHEICIGFGNSRMPRIYT